MLQVLMITNKKLTKKQLNELTGGLSEPSKMPCYSWSISAEHCKTGSKLAQTEGTVCHECYACTNFYRMPTTQNAMARRLQALYSPLYIEAMIETLKRFEKSGYFRWFDSGDLQSVDHLKKIVAICEGTLHLKHWLPTKEYGFVREYIESGNKVPSNLVIRLSGYKVDGLAPTALAKRLGVQVSSVSESDYTCPSSKQGNKCLECRLCFTDAFNVTYKKH